MTTNKRLIVDRPLYHGLRWFQKGTKFPPEGVTVTDAQLDSYEEQGYLISERNLARRENPQAYSAQTELQQVQARVQELEPKAASLDLVLELFTDEVGTPATPQQALDSIRELQREAQAQENLEGQVRDLNTAAAGQADLVGALKRQQLMVVQALRPELTDEEAQSETPPSPVELIGRLRQQRDEARKAQQAAQQAQGDGSALADAQARVKTLEALVKHDGEGTPLPPNFVGRGKLAAHGLDTYESLQGKTAKQLDAIEGLTLEQANKVVDAVAAHFAKGDSGSE